MKHLKWAVALGGLLVLGQPAVQAEEKIYHTHSSEMVEELTREPMKYRSFAPPKKRAIKVVQRIDEKVEETTIMVDEKADIPKLKVKIEFDVNSSALKPASFALLREVGTALNADGVKHRIIMINGHTDSDGSDAHNLRLSFERAESVKGYLMSAYGISRDRLQVRGYGEMMPLRPNDSRGNKQINRRVEFEIAE